MIGVNCGPIIANFQSTKNFVLPQTSEGRISLPVQVPHIDLWIPFSFKFKFSFKAY